MRLKQLLLCILLVVLVRSTTKQDYKCVHDGFSSSDTTCECPSNIYKDKQFYFYSGKTCAQIECTNSGVVKFDEDDNDNQRCSCPPGFLGAHCEPTHCVPGEVMSFDEVSHGRDVSVIITYNTEFQEQVKNKDKNGNLPKTICDSITKQFGVDSDSKIHIWLMETDIETTGANCLQDVSFIISLSCSDNESENPASKKDFPKTCEGDLTTSYIYEALETMGEDSRLIILANTGITDTLSKAGIEAIRKKAISLRTQIHSIVLSPREPLKNTIYFQDGYKLLRELSESTLGFFITPYDAAGGQILGGNATRDGDGITTILGKMMSVFFEYVVVDRISTNTSSCDTTNDFTVFRTMDPTPSPFWLTVTSNGANYFSYDTNWAPIIDNMELTVDAGFFKGYTLPATQGQVFAMYPFSRMGKKCVPTTVLVLAKSNHLARFAITNDDAIDASSPYAISGATDNTLVGHFVEHYHEEHLKSLYLEFSNDNFQADLTKEPYSRPCQYNAKFSDVTCDEGANTLIRVRDYESGAAVTVQSLYCAEPASNAKVPSQDFISFEGPAVPEGPKCTSDIDVTKDKRTLILAAHATETIYKLFNGNSKSAIRYLNDLDNTGHYSNYLVNIFTANDGTDAQSFTDYADFKEKLMEKWNVIYSDPKGKKDNECNATVTDATGAKTGDMDVILPLVDILATPTTPNSDIIYIIDRAIRNPDPADIAKGNINFNDELKTLQRKMYQKRLRLIVLLLGCDTVDFSDSLELKKWNTAATKTGGFMVHFAEPDNLNEFLASYVNWVKGETASSIDGKDIDGNQFSFSSIASTPFQVREGNNYTILVNTLPPLPQVSVSNGNGVETIDRSTLLGNSLSLFEYSAKEDGVLSIQANPLGYFYYSSIRVLESTHDFATIGFTDASCLDSTYPDMIGGSNANKLQFPVTTTVENATVSMTIFTSDGSVLRTGVACPDDVDPKGTKCDPTVRAETSYPLDYNWKCNDQDHVFYISTDVVTEASTFTRVITTQCFGTGNVCDKCINGECKVETAADGTKNTICLCPHDYTGPQCDQPVCQNGGSVTSSLECDCTDDYTGQFCQKYKKCEDIPQIIPQYKSIASTIIFLVERSTFVTDRIKKLEGTTDLFKTARAAQYLVVEYGPDANYTVKISTTDKDLLHGVLTNIKSAEPTPENPGDPVEPTFFDAIPAIKAALQAQTTDSAHLFWFAKDDFLDEDFIAEVFEPIASNRVTISAFFGEQLVDEVTTYPLFNVHPVTLTGGSIFYSKEEDDYVKLFDKYILAIIVYQQTFENRPNTLSIISSSNKTVVHNINIDRTVDKLFLAFYDAPTIAWKKDGANATIGGTDIPGGIAYGSSELDAGEYTITLTYDKEFNRTSSITAMTQNQVAYGFYRRDESDDFMDTAMMGNNVLVTYWLSEGTQYAPSAVITPLTIDGAGTPVELWMTEREDCSYTLSVPINCTGEADAYGVKITNSIIAKGSGSEWKVDKYIPVLCLAAHSCHNGGVATDDGCLCDYFYGGLYCEVDKCTNGDKVNGNKCVCNTGYSGEFCDVFTKPADRAGNGYLFIQDVCGTDEALKDSAQSVYVDYIALLKSSDKFYLGTNEPGSTVVPVLNAAALKTAMDSNRGMAAAGCQATLGDVLDSFYDALRKQSSSASFAAEAAADPSVGAAKVAHVTTIAVDKNMGTSIPRLEHDFDLSMEVVGITAKNDYFENIDSFDNFPAEVTQTYDTEVALLDLVSELGSNTKPVIPDVSKIPRCIKNLQSAFAFHTDISSVPSMTDYRSKASKIIQNVVKYFDIPTVKNIDQDDDTCEFNKDQLADKTQFYGSIYADQSGIGVPTFCLSNMASYPNTIVTADYKQPDQVNLQKVIDSYSKWYNSDQKMTCHCFDYNNTDTAKIIMWTPLSPTSLDTIQPSLDSFELFNVGFTHIVMPMGFTYKDSPLWQKLVPDKENWTTDASITDQDDIIQQIWTITCRAAGHIEEGQTAEPFNPYTVRTKVKRDDDGQVTDDPPTDSPLPR